MALLFLGECAALPLTRNDFFEKINFGHDVAFEFALPWR